MRTLYRLSVGLLWLTVAVATQPMRAAQEPVALARAELLDINRATLAQLAALPGMGDAYARRIVEGRPYRAKNQLVQRGILPPRAYQGIRDLIVAHRVAPQAK